MRIVVKPAGLMIMLASFGVLGYLALRGNSGAKHAWTPGPVVVVSGSPAARPSVPAARPDTGAAASAPAASPLPEADWTPSGWAHIDFQVGGQPGEVEFTGITLDALEGAAR